MPGPNYYKNLDLKPRPKSGKMGKSERKTESDYLSSKSQRENTPGPGSYFKRPISANPSKSSRSNRQKAWIQRKHYLD